jgi:thiosulfate dehydrogenase [quinone] large subunit
MASKEETQFSYMALGLARISLGLIFLWAFFDKLLGLGFATCHNVKTDTISTVCSQAWVRGGSPTAGFLEHATKGPLADFYQALAGHTIVDWIFMAALLLIGVALLLGIAMRLAVVAGSLLLLMMWSAALPPANNPILDEHIVYVFLLLGLPASNTRQKLSLGVWWNKQKLVKRYPFLV